jgi:hypothetical protein
MRRPIRQGDATACGNICPQRETVSPYAPPERVRAAKEALHQVWIQEAAAVRWPFGRSGLVSGSFSEGQVTGDVLNVGGSTPVGESSIELSGRLRRCPCLDRSNPRRRHGNAVSSLRSYTVQDGVNSHGHAAAQKSRQENTFTYKSRIRLLLP